jgi:hypothetical protein
MQTEVEERGPVLPPMKENSLENHECPPGFQSKYKREHAPWQDLVMIIIITKNAPPIPKKKPRVKTSGYIFSMQNSDLPSHHFLELFLASAKPSQEIFCQLPSSRAAGFVPLHPHLRRSSGYPEGSALAASPTLAENSKPQRTRLAEAWTALQLAVAAAAAAAQKVVFRAAILCRQMLQAQLPTP